MLFVVLVLCLVLFVLLPLIHATLWALFTTLLVGLVLGTVARIIAPGESRMGCLTTSLVGVLGALLGTAAARGFGLGSFSRLLLQVASAVVLVMVLRPNRGVRT